MTSVGNATVNRNSTLNGGPLRERDERCFGANLRQARFNPCGCPAWIRTTIDGVRVRSLTIRRRGSLGCGEIERALFAVNGGQGAQLGLPNPIKL